ncbi:hypothetical protein [Collimonas sp.]|uniref:hypothetical protein n=1 Tax=Collimonas sp. TaxID=1963772 RepID=UPI0037C0AE0B
MTLTLIVQSLGAAHALQPTRIGRQTRGLTSGYGLTGFGDIITATFVPVIACG